MIYVLDLIYVFLSVLFMGGRLYELINYTDFDTGYMSFKGIVSNPAIIVLLLVIAFCCSMIIFPFKEEQHPKMKFKIGVPAFIASVFFMCGAVINIIWIFRVGGFLGFDIFVILGALSMIFFAMADIKARKIEKVPFLLVMLIPASFCVRSMLFNVFSVSNSIVTQRNMAYVATFAFLILMFKNAYSPTRHSDTALYAVALANFSFSCAGMLALIVGQLIKTGIVWESFFSDMAFVFMGVLSLVTAFNLNKKSEMSNVETDDNGEVIEVSAPIKEQHIKKPKPKKEKYNTKEVKKVVYKADK